MTAPPGVPTPDPDESAPVDAASVDPPPDLEVASSPPERDLAQIPATADAGIAPVPGPSPSAGAPPAPSAVAVEAPPPAPRRSSIGPVFRTAVAFTMAAVAIASASVAYYSARWASLAAASEGVALQQRAERDRTEQRINIQVAEDTRLWTVYQAHWEAASALQAEAQDLRASNPSRTRLLDLEYQGHVAAMTALWPLFQGSFPQTDASGKLGFDVDAARAGIEASDENLPLLDPEARHLEAQAGYARALALVLLIVMFIAALFVLTIAQVYGRFARISAAVGVGLAIGTATQITVVDPEITLWLILAAAGALGLSVVQLLGVHLPGRFQPWFRSEGQETEVAGASMEGADRSRIIHEHGTPEPPIVGPEVGRDRVTRLLAVSIAAMTLIAAGIGYLQIQTARGAEDQAILAQHHALMALSTEIQGSTDAEASIFAHVRRIETQVAAANVRQQRLYWLSVGDSQRADDLSADLEARDSEAKAAVAADSIPAELGPLDYGADPPRGDSTFPARFRAGFDEPAYMHAAMQDAANDAAALLTSRGRDYSFAVAVLAVVLYLLGLSLVLRARGLRVIFVAASAVLVIIAAAVIAPAVSDIVSGREPSEAAANEAAENYAAGVVGSTVAADRSQMTAAIDRLQAAVDARPAFAEAYVALARASLAAGSPQSGSNLSVEDPQTVERTIELLRRAKLNGAATAESELDLGFLLYRQAIQPQPLDAAGLADSIAVTQGAIDRLKVAQDDLRAIAEGNLGVADLAAGHTADSLAAYDRALAAIARHHGATDRDDEYYREAKVAGLLTDLDNLATKQPAFVDSVRTTKEYVVGHLWPSTGASAVKVSSLEISVTFRSMLEWLAVASPKTGFDRDHVVIQWYRQDLQSGDWFVLADISGSAKKDSVWLYPDSDLGPDGFYGIGQMTSSSDLHCLADGEHYRVEVYVDGRLAAEAGSTVAIETGGSASTAADMAAVGARDLGLAFCHPRGWKQTLTEPGLALGYEDPSFTAARRGILAFRVQQPGQPLPSGECPDGSATRDAIAEVLGDAGYRSTLPALTLSESSTLTAFLTWRCMANAYYITPLEPGQGSDDQQYAYIRAAPNSDGSITVVVVMGPYSDFKVKGTLGLILISTLLPYG
jgi:hypothetical protein